MKSLEELAWTSADLPSLLTTVILAEVEEAARTRRFGRNLVRINEDLIRTKGRNLVFYRRGTLIASPVGEASDLSGAGQTISYTPNTLTVSKIGVPVLISQEAIDGSNLDLIRDSITEAGIALADAEDTSIVQTILGYSHVSDTIAAAQGGTYTLSDTPVLTTPTVAGNTITAIDYFSGIVVVSNTSRPNTFDFYSSTRTNFVDVFAPGSFSYNDIMTAANVIRGNKWEPDFMMIHPDQMNDLLKNTQFVDFSKYGAREPLLRGEIGMISGMKVLVTTAIPTGNAIVIASKRAAWLAIKRPIDLKRWDNPRTDSIELYFYMEFGVSVTDEDAVCIITNMESGAVNL